MSYLPDQNVALTEDYVLAKSINSLGQVEATIGSMRVALCGPLVESDAVFLSMSDALDAKRRCESGSALVSSGTT